MRAFVQASVKSRGFYWVTAEDNAEVADAYPQYGFRDCMSLVDAALPSLVIAAVPTDENYEKYKLALLILSLEERTENIYINIPPVSLFLIFEPEEEASLRALAVALLSPIGKAQKHYSHNAQVADQVNACIEKSFRLVRRDGREMREDFFTVSADFFSSIDRIIETESRSVLRTEQAKFVRDYGFVAKTSLTNQQELAAWLCENSLHLERSPASTLPLIVVTANKLPKKHVAAGAWRVMSNLVESDTWKALQTEPGVVASTIDSAKKATSKNSFSTSIRFARPVRQEEAESTNESDDNSNSESNPFFQPARAERKVPSLKEWGKQLVSHLSLLPAVISNSVQGTPKRDGKDSADS